jgi:predicted MFS family arabinose efflux permease
MLNKPINPWWNVLAGFIGNFFTAGVVLIYAISFYTKAISTDNQFDRGVLSFSFTCFLIATGIGTITLGRLIHSWGIRMPAIGFLLIYGCTLAAVPLLPPTPSLFYLTFFIMGVSGAAATAIPYAVAVTGYFDRRRGLALGLVVAGGGAGSTFLPHLANYLFDYTGWKTAMFLIALMVTVIPILGLTFLVRTPEGVANRHAKSRTSQSLKEDWNLYLGKKDFWIMALTVIGMSVATFGVLANLVPLLTDRGFTPQKAAMLMSVAGLSSWIGRVIIGYILDKTFGPYVTSAICMLCMIGVILVLIGDTAIFPLILASALVGTTMGSEGDLITFLSSRYFSLDSFSRVIGAMWVMWSGGGGLGTYIAGVVYNLTESYAGSLIFFAFLLLLSGILILRLGPYTYPAK